MKCVRLSIEDCLIEWMELTVLSVTFCLKDGMSAASIGVSRSSERSSTALSKSLKYNDHQNMSVSSHLHNAPLIILEKILLITRSKVISHRICPLERHTAFINLFDGFLHELDLRETDLDQNES